MDRITFNQAAARILGREHEEHGIGTLGEKTLHAIIKNYVEPDISIICDPGKLHDKGCIGAPDWIIEIISLGSRQMDYYTKLFKYRASGVKEYWIVDPERDRILVYNFETEKTGDYTFSDSVKADIYDDLYIDFSGISELLKK